MTLLIDSNVIRQTSGDSRAIGLAFRGPANPLAATLGPNTVISDVTVTNNSVIPGAAPSGFPLSAIMIEADNQTGADNKSPTVRADVRANTVPATAVFDLLSTQLGYYEYDAVGGHGIGQLVDTAPASADATAQLTSTNTGSASAFGVALIAGPIIVPAFRQVIDDTARNTYVGTLTTATRQYEQVDALVSEASAEAPYLALPSTRTNQPNLSRPKRNRGAVLRYSTSGNFILSQPVAATQGKKKPGQIIVSKPVPLAPNAGETISPNIGTIPAGKSVTITYQVTVNTPYLGGSNVSNQGTVSGSNFSSVLTDDPAVGGANDPTLTPIKAPPVINISDAQANEPAAGFAPMLFIVSLNAPAPAGGVSVHYATADQTPGTGHAVAGTDYTAVADTTLNFAAGDQVKTVTVNVLADADAPEPDETFLFNLSNATNGVIVDAQATGTIKQGNASGTFLISEIRTSGPGGTGDDFVELYNNTDSPLTVAASDASAGYGVYKIGADCTAAPVLIATIPNGTVIPARGHYLLVGSQYSLADCGGTGAAAGDQTLTSDIESDRNVAVFSTAEALAVSSANRLDAVGFGTNTDGVCDLLREGTTLPAVGGGTPQHSFQRDICGKGGSGASGICPSGTPVDTNNNATNFIFADTAATVIGGVTQRLGAPGPENLVSPLVRNSTIIANLLDQSVAAAVAPNRVRDLTPGPVATSTNGTMSIRRRWTNNTGANVTRLRFRIVDISSLTMSPVPLGTADLRAITSVAVTGVAVNDSATCAATGTPNTAPCMVTVQGTTLETPPAQPNGGALNSTLAAGTITVGTPLANNASINLQFLLGVQQTGAFKFYIIVEALP